MQTTGVRRLIWVILLCGAWGAAAGQEMATADNPIRSCAAIRALTPEQAATGLPVEVRGVVTLLPLLSADQLSFTVDDGTGIWVSPPRRNELAETPPRLRIGDLVVVRGHTLAGRFSPTIARSVVRVIGRGALPVPQEVTALGLASGKFDSQRVVLTGVVQAAEMQEGPQPVLRLKVHSAVGLFTYFLLGPKGVAPDTLVDADVELTGVCLSYFNSRRQFLGARIYSNAPDDLHVVRRGDADPFTAPPVALREVMAFSPRGAELHRRRVRGVVTLSNRGEYFYIQDGRSALRVNTHQPGALEPGDVVEAAGFFDLQHHRAEMHDAVFRRIGHQTPPQPVEITRELAFAREPTLVYQAPEDYDDRLIAVRGRLLSIDDKPDGPLRMNLVCDGVLVPAEFPAAAKPSLGALREGSEVRATGVCQLTFSASRPVVDWPQPVAMRLLVRGVADVEVIKAAPFWTAQRLGLALATTLGVLLAALGWAVTLRRRVALRGQQLAEAMRARRDAAVEFETAVRERNRLAADLHDTMEQTLTGLALQIEAGQAMQATTPQRSQQHLSLASQLLARSREDLRRSIWNLRANPLERQTLAQALEEIAVDRSRGTAVTITVESKGGVQPLPDFIAGNMLLLAQEGITNAFKHAEPSRISLELNFAAGSVTLTIRDDGRGFDPAVAHGPAQGHFGLQGMRERVKRLGGKLKIVSAPGAGTTIIATVSC